MIAWTFIDVPIYHKCLHVHKAGKRAHRGFCKDYGDLPFAHYNEITRKWEAVVNTRGRAYAARNRLKYRRKNNI